MRLEEDTGNTRGRNPETKMSVRRRKGREQRGTDLP
jgi:hypothetical protein